MRNTLTHKAQSHTRSSLRKNLIVWFLLCILPILIILSVCVALSARSFREQMRAYVQQMIQPYAAQIDTILSTSQRYIGGLNPDLSSLASNSGDSQLERFQGIQELGDTISSSLTSYTYIDAVFLYSNETLCFVQNTNRSYTKNYQAAKYMEKQYQENEISSNLLGHGYLSFQAGDSCYLYIASEISDGVVGCWFEEENLLDFIVSDSLPGLLDLALADADGVPLNSSSESADIDSGIFTTLTELEEAPFSILASWDEATIFSSFYRLTGILILCLVLSCTLFTVYIFALRRSFIQPLSRLIHTIRGLRKTDFAEIPTDPKEPQEVQEVVSALNTMIGEVKDLKIQVYEEQIRKQQTQMQLYQLQLRPHFLLNMLNNLISYAQLKDFSAVKKLAYFLSAHCRYILYNTWFVSMEEELAYTRSYMEIQNMRQDSRCVRYLEQYDDSVLDCEIPILCIQIFVENALKHAESDIPDFTITVVSHLLETDAGEILSITISDNGHGFSEEALASFQEDPVAPESGSGHGIGIYNVRERLNILYRSEASVSFSNKEDGGAQVELRIPTDPQRRKQ